MIFEERESGEGGPEIATSSSSSASQGQRSVSGFQQQNPGIGPDMWDSTRAPAALDAPGYTVLFNGLDQGRIAGLFDEAGTWFVSPPF